MPVQELAVKSLPLLPLPHASHVRVIERITREIIHDALASLKDMRKDNK
jgi:hypothetical protein